MLTVGVLGLLLLAALAVLFMVVIVGRRRLEVVFGRIAWIPLAALLLQAVLFKPLIEALSYAAMLIPLLTCIVSVLLTVIGATLVASARERGEPRSGLVRSTVLASIPALLLAAYVLYETTARTFRQNG